MAVNPNISSHSCAPCDALIRSAQEIEDLRVAYIVQQRSGEFSTYKINGDMRSLRTAIDDIKLVVSTDGYSPATKKAAKELVSVGVHLMVFIGAIETGREDSQLRRK